jgi:uncharacterized short protein YbdD (DUF466 family)
MWRSMSHADRPALAARLRRAWRTVVRTARLAVGVPDYDTYVRHCRRHHPDRAPMSREAFFRERMDARYGRGRSRCC